ncbi:alpha/beta fold hydrolase [Streptomyces lydicamycinicus]|uniref:alpha/beta fold hydrolase n=1 Tax=Streptomyces lydicamycinicus TaxID=1546107 RepID=UPI003C2EA859
MAARPHPLPLTADADLIAAFEVLGQKWTGVILHTLATRPARYGELSAAIEHISTKVLADRLRELVGAGLVTHAQLPPGPATYTLTADGRALLPALEQLRSWSQHRPHPPRHSSRKATPMSARTLPEATFARTVLGSGPGLALAHGAGSSVAGTYGPILDGLAAHHTVVGVDYPGSGDTPRSATPLSLDDLADQLAAAAVAEGLETFAVSGYSLGGPVAIRAAARHSERVTALVLTATFPHRDNRLALALPVWRKLAESGNRALLAEYLTMMALGADALEAMPDEQLQQAIGFTAASVAEGTPEHAELAPRVDVRDDLPGIQAPTLVISTTQDRFTSTRLHRQLADTIPHAQLVEIATGHLPMVERPEEWRQLITDFLKQHSA